MTCWAASSQMLPKNVNKDIVPGTILGTWNTQVNKTKSPYPGTRPNEGRIEQ